MGLPGVVVELVGRRPGNALSADTIFFLLAEIIVGSRDVNLKSDEEFSLDDASIRIVPAEVCLEVLGLNGANSSVRS